MSNAIKYWRKERNMSQQKLADLIGIDRPTLSKIENPNISIDPDEELAFKIARILEVLVTDIIKDKNITIHSNDRGVGASTISPK